MTPELPEPTGVTWHLAVADEWAAQRPTGSYAPATFEQEGFVHCTDGLDRLVDTANRYYRHEPHDLVALAIDLGAVDVPARYDNAPTIYPHVYGRIPVIAVIDERPAERAADGTITGFPP